MSDARKNEQYTDNWYEAESEVHSSASLRQVMKSSRGFTLLEIIVTVALIGIMVAVAVPSVNQMKLNLRYKSAAQGCGSILRKARTDAIALNREHQVEFDIDGRRYRLTRGNLPNASTSWTQTVGWVTLPDGASFMRNLNCDNNTDVDIQFNPNGTGDSQYVCVMDASGTRRYRVGVPSGTTGRVIVE